MNKKVGLIGLYHESNTFVKEQTTLVNFKKGRFLKGVAIRNEYKDAHHEIGGMIEVMDREEIELIPVMYAEATPGGTITGDTYQSLLQEMLQEIDKILPVDAFLVVPHGAGVSDTFLDMDGHWLQQLREKVGPDIPIIGTLDLHANVSPLMVKSTDALVSYRQNPHVDQRDRGKDAANILVRQLQNKVKATQILIQVPLAVSIEQQLTSNEPCKSLYEYAAELAAQESILSLSIQLGFPYADVKEMGTSIIVVSDNNSRLANSIGEKLKDYIIQNKERFVGEKIDVATSVTMISDNRKPVLLLDMGDNIGGGSPGNNISLLEALEEKNEVRYFVSIYDPNAVLEAEKQKAGESFTLSILGTEGEQEKKIELNVELKRMCDGNFKEVSPRHGGQVNYKMGKTAIVSTKNGSVVMITSLRIPPFSLQQLLAFDVIPEHFDAIVAKGVNAPIAAYAPVCPTIIQVNTPGVTQADMTKFTFHNRRKPLFPFEQDIN